MMMKPAVLAIPVCALFLASCATSIPVKVTKPPEADLRGIKTVCVMPIGYPGDGTQVEPAESALIRLEKRYAYPSDDERAAARRFESGIAGVLSHSGAFAAVSAEDLRAGIAAGRAASDIADAYFIGEFDRFDVNVVSGTNKSKDELGNDVLVYRVRRNVGLDLSYRMIRSSDGAVLWRASKEASDHDERTSGLSLKSAAELVDAIAYSVLPDIAREIAPRVVTERRTLEPDRAKDPRMKLAARSAEEGSYAEALVLYDQVYSDTGNYAAGFNGAIVAELLGDYEGAIAKMDSLFKSTGDLAASKELERMRKAASDADRMKALEE
jgi:hypothetical protein